MAGTLFVVATPVGNLSDISPRALEVLRSASLVACEDTRTSLVLLSHYGIATHTVALHAHNEKAASGRLIDSLKAGQDIALISDAGTPALSDPGAHLVEAAHRAGVRVSPIPGPSAALAAWSASGFATDRFLFAGFLPSARAARRKALELLAEPEATVFYEAPHRVLETIEDLLARFGEDRELVIAREVTKKFEQVVRMRLGDAPAWLLGGTHRRQGEFVLVLGPGKEGPGRGGRDAQQILRILLEALPPSDAARITARITGMPRKELYASALAASGAKGPK